MIVTTELINALHFRRGIQNMQVWDMEWEIPIPPLPSKADRLVGANGTNGSHTVQRRLSKRRSFMRSTKSKAAAPATLKSARESLQPSGTKRDWSILQKAWWDAILLMEQHPNEVRVALEMRVLGSSEITLAPERGNNLGTCSIEILTNLNPPVKDWNAFCQKVTDKWISYTDRTTGRRLRARPHWCKQFGFLTFHDNRGKKMTATEWLRKIVYKNEFPEFLGILKKIGEQQGFTNDDLRARFANRFLESLFWGVPDVEGIVRPDSQSRRITNKIKSLFRSCFG